MENKNPPGSHGAGLHCLLWVLGSARGSPLLKSLRRIWVEGRSAGGLLWLGLELPQGILPRRSQPRLHSSPAPGSRRLALRGERGHKLGVRPPHLAVSTTPLGFTRPRLPTRGPMSRAAPSRMRQVPIGSHLPAPGALRRRPRRR